MRNMPIGWTASSGRVITRCIRFFVLSAHGLERLDFQPITIFYGGNGSGKTTAINVIAERLGLSRNARYNRSDFFGEYVKMCSHSFAAPLPEGSAVLASDDVFAYMQTHCNGLVISRSPFL